jgi:2Fe-2S ferredoxin
MVKVRFRSDSGAEEEIEAAPGATLMSAAVRRHVAGIDAICGGSMVCGTCHVYVHPDWRDRLPPASAAEQDLLDCGLAVRPESRLACQIVVTSDLEGLVVTTPASQI